MESSSALQERIAGRKRATMAKRKTPPGSPAQPSLPHEDNREGKPYATEVEDYHQGVAKPPEEQGAEVRPRGTRARTKT